MFFLSCCTLFVVIQFVVGHVQKSAITISDDSWGNSAPENAPVQEFYLRQAFYHDLEDLNAAAIFFDVEPDAEFAHISSAGSVIPFESLRVRSKQLHMSKARIRQDDGESEQQVLPLSSIPESQIEWVLDDVPGPDVTNRDTIINLAKMTSDAYIIAPKQPDWLNTTLGFNHSYSFGWSGDGLRGHIFTDKLNETIIVAYKGTSVDPRDKWQNNDRVNDNLLFSCCCATQRPDPYPYGPVCGCRTGTYQCNSTCLTTEILQPNRYYPAALAVLHNVTELFPGATYWVTGHSMGGAVASLVGLTYNLPVVTFEAPGERLPAQRLGLTVPSHPGSFHIGNTADPVFMGACNGWSSSCSLGGYAFESQCFTGKRCIYDTVGDRGWRSSISNHRINTVITEVLEKYDTVPKCEPDLDCYDCFNWKFNASQTARSKFSE